MMHTDVMPQPAAAPAALGRPRVLLVEDDDLIREALEILLSERLDVTAAESAEKALERFVAGRFDVLVTDLGLPGRKGNELRQALAEVDPSMTAILITADDLSRDDPRIAGFEGWWQKPLLDLDGFVDRVDEVARRNRLRRAG
jgi:two-component system CheB/CheR fusion protein